MQKKLCHPHVLPNKTIKINSMVSIRKRKKPKHLLTTLMYAFIHLTLQLPNLSKLRNKYKFLTAKFRLILGYQNLTFRTIDVTIALFFGKIYVRQFRRLTTFQITCRGKGSQCSCKWKLWKQWKSSIQLVLVVNVIWR